MAFLRLSRFYDFYGKIRIWRVRMLARFCSAITRSNVYASVRANTVACVCEATVSLIAYFAKTKGIAIGSDLYNTACKHAEGGGGIFSYGAKAAGRKEVSAREFVERGNEFAGIRGGG